MQNTRRFVTSNRRVRQRSLKGKLTAVERDAAIKLRAASSSEVAGTSAHHRVALSAFNLKRGGGTNGRTSSASYSDYSRLPARKSGQPRLYSTLNPPRTKPTTHPVPIHIAHDVKCIETKLAHSTEIVLSD